MHMDLSTHIGYQFWNPTEMKNKLSAKCSSSLILRENEYFMGWSIGRDPEVVESGA